MFVRDGSRKLLPLEPTVLRPGTPADVADRRGRQPESSHWRAQPTGDGGLLLIDRFRWPGERNALRFDPDGRLVARFEAGDRVEEALLDSRDRLWMSFFDEGISSDDPISQLALARFELDGRRSWPLGDEWGVPWGVNDPWAINVEGEMIWMVYDSNAEQATRLFCLASGDDPTTWTVPEVATCYGLLLDAGTAV